MALAPQNVGHTTSKAGEAGLVARPYLLAFALVTSLFFMWAIANNFNDILIKQFQKALDLTRMQSGLVQTAFYFGYFTIALPAGWVMTKVGYKNGILIGLALYATGAALFYPAAEVRQFGFFLLALYVIAAGLAFLETAANPFITAMGPKETAAQRLNLAQSFNGLGGFVAPFLGGALIFSGVEHSQQELTAMSPAALDAYLASEAQAVQLPYLGLAAVVLALAALIFFARFPTIPEDGQAAQQTDGPDRSIWSFRHLRWAVVAQFFYVGAQVGIWSYFINFAQDAVGVGEKTAANYLGFSLMGFMIGRFAGTALMRFVSPERLLVIYGLIAAALCAVAIATTGWTSVIALGLTSFFMSIMFPTIFALGIEDLGDKTKLGSSLIIMAIIGGALFPPLIGWTADQAGSIHTGMAVTLVSFLIIVAFGMAMGRRRADGVARG
ncbi:L-fucose:H+ symporter permease [Erythrobacter aureus]|uniref:L-fucose:H+ symporter permease n=1 Tax=Erythrobacter aureus TaxID=2182384 RepID=A0A345YB11_9SPHN|nr:L-fucose:H+ symporter permease [Erythrobacter aureus]AXK41113.1 L-fucose:H+ symporter permease [Erythrobacter aureus]